MMKCRVLGCGVLRALSTLVVFIYMYSACMIVVEPTPPVASAPKVLDILVLSDTERSTAALASGYNDVVSLLVGFLSEQNVRVRAIGLAPLYRRLGDTVPLLFGEGDKSASVEFARIDGALRYFAADSSSLTLGTEDEGANLAVLGKALPSTGIYYPNQHSTNPRAYFEPPVDGFVVLTLSATPRRCAYNECSVQGMSVAEYFTATEEGQARWLKFPGAEGLPVARIMHLAVSAAEGGSYDEFYTACRAEPNFPSALLDAIEPSPKPFFGPMTKAISEAGGRAMYLDLCTVLSSGAASALKSAAKKIADML